MAHFSHGAVHVVGHGFYQNRHATLAVAFIGDFIHVGIVITAGTTLNGPIDGVAGHVLAQRLVDGRPQTRIIVGLAAAHLRGHGELANQFGKILPRLASWAALRCLMLAHLLCPAMLPPPARSMRHATRLRHASLREACCVVHACVS